MSTWPGPDDAYAAIALGRWLRQWRASTGASQRTFARLARIDQAGLSRIERGLQGRPSARRLARLLVVLDWLSGGGDPLGPWAGTTTVRPEWVPPHDGPRPPPVVGRRPLPPAEAWLVGDLESSLDEGEDPEPWLEVAAA